MIYRIELNGKISPGATQSIKIKEPVNLSNIGGIITLLDDRGLKVDGISYTRTQARHSGGL